MKPIVKLLLGLGMTILSSSCRSSEYHRQVKESYDQFKALRNGGLVLVRFETGRSLEVAVKKKLENPNLSSKQKGELLKMLHDNESYRQVNFKELVERMEGFDYCPVWYIPDTSVNKLWNDSLFHTIVFSDMTGTPVLDLKLKDNKNILLLGKENATNGVTYNFSAWVYPKARIDKKYHLLNRRKLFIDNKSLYPFFDIIGWWGL